MEGGESSSVETGQVIEVSNSDIVLIQTPEINNFTKQNNDTLFSKLKLQYCNDCNTSFDTETEMKNHLCHNPKNISEFICSECNFKCKSKLGLRKHEEKHKKDATYVCKLCLKSFKTQIQLRLHNSKHLRVTPYSCNLCKESFTTINHLELHKIIHEGHNSHPCKDCNELFETANELELHNSKVHFILKPHICRICKISFSNLDDLENHEIKHPDINIRKTKYICSRCKETFEKINEFKSHRIRGCEAVKFYQLDNRSTGIPRTY